MPSKVKIDEHNYVQVFCRVKPLLKQNDSITSAVDVKGKIVSISTRRYQYKFCFDGVITGVDQNAVFNNVGLPILKSVFNGFNSTIFVYGQTGSGKSYTMMGEDLKRRKGLATRIIENMLTRIKDETNSSISASVIEIYQDKLKDLLNNQENQSLKIRLSGKTVCVDRCTSVKIASVNSMQKLIRIGIQNRVVGSHNLNTQSSRSHLAIMISLNRKQSNTKLFLVDLAGSEKLKQTNSDGKMREETKEINKSLACLARVINSLTDERHHIPYRDCKLTKLLQDALGGYCKTKLIVNISSSPQHVEESASTLRFGSCAKNVYNGSKSNIRRIGDAQIRKLNHKLLKEKIKLVPCFEKRIFKGDTRSILRLELDIKLIRTSNGKVLTASFGPPSGQLLLLLHAFSNSSGFHSWRYMYKPLSDAGFHVVGIDFPGFGESTGDRNSSRSEHNTYKNGPCDIVRQIIKANNSSSAIIIGYDWGASVGISLAISTPKFVSRLIAFHPSFTNTSNILTKLATKTLLLWVDSDQFHPSRNGKQMEKSIPNAQMVLLKCGRFSKKKSSWLYETISEQILREIYKFLFVPLPKSSKDLDHGIKQSSSSISEHHVCEEKCISETLSSLPLIDDEIHDSPDECIEDSVDSEEEINISTHLQRGFYQAKEIVIKRKPVPKIEVDLSRSNRVLYRKHKQLIKEPFFDDYEYLESRIDQKQYQFVESNVFTPGGTVHVYNCGPDTSPAVLLLHGWGFKSSSRGWKFMFKPLITAGFRLVAIDQPGFGKTNGHKHNSRASTNMQKSGPVEIVLAVLDHFKINKAITLGYSWGGGIAISYTDEDKTLHTIKHDTLILWFPVDQVHPFALGQYFLKEIPNSKMVVMDCGRFIDWKGSWNYETFDQEIVPPIMDFITPDILRSSDN